MEQSKIPVSATAYRRQRQIEECLFENLQQRPYPSVSISDLCLQLGISRKSFYNYFPDKDSCFRSLLKRKLHTCYFHLTMDLPEDASAEEIISAFLVYWKEEKALFDVMMRNNLLYMLIDQYILFIRDDHPSLMPLLDTLQIKADEYVICAFVNVQISLLIRWYMANFSTPMDEMVHTFLRLLYEPLLRKKETVL